MNQIRAVLVITFPVAIFLVVQSDSSTEALDNKSLLNGHGDSINISSLSRSKRQYQASCPSGCFPSCQTSSQCQQVAPRMVCVQFCCCPAISPGSGGLNSGIINLGSGGLLSGGGGSINIIPIPVPIGPINTFGLGTACDGGPAAAACINGLCGQGFYCNPRGFCCRCVSGNSTGPCINNLCPAGYSCNTNNFCCPLGSGSVLGPCINGQCPSGYTCGAGNLCYSVAIGGLKKRK